MISLGRTSATRAVTKNAIDLAVVGVAVVAAYVVRLEAVPSGAIGRQMIALAIALPFVRFVAARLSGAHRSSWRLFGLPEAVVLGRALVGVSLVLVAVRIVMPWVAPSLPVIPLGVIALETFFTGTGMVAARVIVRLLDEETERRTALRDRAGKAKRALLVGAGRAGRMAARELRARPDAGYQPVGFLDDAASRAGQVIEGVPVLGTSADAAAVARTLRADTIILTIPSATRRETQAVVERCRGADLPIHTVPGLHELIAGTVGITTIRPLQIEDLLRRDVVEFDEIAVARVRRAFAGKRVLVTGAGGSIGSELCRQLAELDPATLILLESNENNLFAIEQELLPRLRDRLRACLVDIRTEADVAEAFAEQRPQVVFHAAAFKHVPLMELHPTKAVDNNVRGTRIVAEAARRFGAERFVLVSTDKAVNPSSVMGASKRAAEMLVLAMRGTTRFSAVRFGNVLGSNGSVVHTFAQQIARGGPVTVTHPDITRFFMTIPEAVRLVLQAAAAGQGGEVFLLDMGEPVKVLDLAKQMIRLAGYDEADIPIDIVGLRPGEKLHEELVRQGEWSVRADVPGVWLAKESAPALPDVAGWITSLEDTAAAGDAHGAQVLLAKGTGYRAPPGVEETDPRANVDTVIIDRIVSGHA